MMGAMLRGCFPIRCEADDRQDRADRRAIEIPTGRQHIGAADRPREPHIGERRAEAGKRNEICREPPRVRQNDRQTFKRAPVEGPADATIEAKTRPRNAARSLFAPFVQMNTGSGT